MDKYTTDFEYFWNLIFLHINFTFARYADGEVMLMKGEEVTEDTQAYRVDNWKATTGVSKVGQELLDTLNHSIRNSPCSGYFYAISGISDNPNDYNFLRERIQTDERFLTFVNLWINANYEKTKNKLASLNREVILICNEAAKKESFPFPVKSISPFPNNCIEYWKTNSEYYINHLIETYGKEKDKLFMISCGPVSEIIIHRLYTNNPFNTYIDMGSALDEYIHGWKTRPYMDPKSRYAREKSHF